MMKTEHQLMEPPVAQFHRQVLGEVELIALSDGGINYPAAMIFGNVPPENAARYHLPERQLFLPYTPLLVKRGRSLTLCDVGAGDLGNPGDQAFPGLDHRTSRTNLLVPSLLAAGIDPGKIDTVLVTHAHPDHVGGMVDAEGGLVFPNARYFIAQKEWDYWMSVDPAAAGAAALRGHLEQLVATARKALEAIAGRVTLVPSDEEVAPGIRLESTPGHTPGHVMVTIAAGGQRVYHVSDLVVHPLFIEHPQWAPAIDMDAGQADAVRRRFFARASEENALVFGHHLGPFPNLGRIVQWGDAWQWQPTRIAGHRLSLKPRTSPYAAQPRGTMPELTYASFMVRMWRSPVATATHEHEPVWMGELESIQTGRAWQFQGLEPLLALLATRSPGRGDDIENPAP